MRQLDKEATRLARARHAAGLAVLRAIFGYDASVLRAGRLSRHKEQGSGPSGTARFTRKHWTRQQRRATTKAQRLARRRNRP